MYAQVSSEERQALIDFYNATNGDNWKNTTENNQPWLVNDPNSLVTDWYGVNVTNGKVTKLDMFKNNLTGTLPVTIGVFTEMNQLVLSSNDIGGALPDSLIQLTKLRSLHLSGNEFIGPIPILKILNATAITHLYFDRNNFSGVIPPQIGQLSNLMFVNLGYNELTGSIPIEFSQLKKISSLYFSGNQLSGAIPPQLSEMTNLRTLTFTDNNFTGTIPPELGNLTTLGSLSFAGNQLTGTIPPELGQLTNLYALSLNGNQLTGTIPPELGQLTKVVRLYMTSNDLTGSIPSEFDKLVALENLQLGDNQLSGSIPPGLGVLPKLKSIGLRNNQLTGNIPAEFGELTTLEHAHLHNNNFTGVIPDSFSGLTSLKALYLYGNALSGKVPGAISTLPNLTAFGISGNKFVFSDFEADFTAFNTNISSFTYNQMQKTDSEETLNVAIGGSITLTSDSFTSPNNEYQWYKNNSAIPGATSKEYTISNAAEADAGVYKLLATNSTITGINIYRNDLTLTVSQSENTCGVSEIEKQALIDLYNATDGANWTNSWDLTTPVCDWYGVTVIGGKVTILNLRSNQLVGVIPETIGNLGSLETLDFKLNQLSGSIPSSLGQLVNLVTVYLHENQLSGSVPATLGQLVNLETLVLSNNQLSGNIPLELGQLINLKSLTMNVNQLSGNIPGTLGQLVNLQSLQLKQNQLSGTIPSALGELSSLQRIYLNNNNLSGNIPVSLGQLGNLEELHLFQNELSGSIPAELGQLSNLRILYLYNNQLSGTIPPELGQLFNLKDLNFYGNQLSGDIPASFSQFASIESLTLANNQLSGIIPSGLSEISSITGLYLSGNKFTFSSFETEFNSYQTNLNNFTYIPQAKVDSEQTLSVETNASITLSTTALTSTNNSYQWYKDGVAITDATNKDLLIENAVDADAGVYHFTATNSSVTDLTLERNPITLSVTPAVNTCGVSDIEKQALIDLYNTTSGTNWTNSWDLTAPVCNWYGVTVVDDKVTELDLHDNNLTGTISGALGQLVNLEILYLHENPLEGNLPSELGQLINLKSFVLYATQVTGNIPAELGQLTNLETLAFYYNQFTGTIPPELGQMTNLVNLYLGSNQLTGIIPAELGQLTNLQRLDAYNNNLTGNIPVALGGLTKLLHLGLGKNQLTGAIPSELSDIVDFNSFKVDQNNFVFSDLEQSFTAYATKLGADFVYAPQAKVDSIQALSIPNGGSITLSTTALTSTNNSYQWYKDDVAITGATTKDLLIENAVDADAGVYYFTATNSSVTDLILERNPITLSITSTGNELGVTINTVALPNANFDVVSGDVTMPDLASGNPDSETLVNLGADTGENKIVLINVKPSQNAAKLDLRFTVSSTEISNVQVLSNNNWLDFSPEFYRIEGKTIYFMNKRPSVSVPFTMNLVNGVQYDSSAGPLVLTVDDGIDLTGATLEIILPEGFGEGGPLENTSEIVQPSPNINGFEVNGSIWNSGSYKFILTIQGKSFKGAFLVSFSESE